MMNDLERFKAVARFERPDYLPIFGFRGAPGMSWGCMDRTHDRLIATGMPAGVGGRWNLSKGLRDGESWNRYWGTTGPIVCDFQLGIGVRGFDEKRRIEGEFEIIESECGAVTRQVIDNDVTYSMPDFVAHPVRDRKSWEFYRQRMTPAAKLPSEEMEQRCRPYDTRTRPLAVSTGGRTGFCGD